MKRRNQEETPKKAKITLELDEEMIKNIEKIATLKKIPVSELINKVLHNFEFNFKRLIKEEKSDISDEEKYLEYMDSLRKLLSDSSLSEKSKKYIIG